MVRGRAQLVENENVAQAFCQVMMDFLAPAAAFLTPPDAPLAPRARARLSQFSGVVGMMKKVATQLGVAKGSEEDEAAKNRCVQRCS